MTVESKKVCIKYETWNTKQGKCAEINNTIMTISANEMKICARNMKRGDW